LIVTCFITSLS